MKERGREGGREERKERKQITDRAAGMT
jgi:hypothetical protein